MLEIHALTRPQPGRAANEDAFVFGYAPLPYAVVCDGAGRAESAARKACRQFQRLFAAAALDDLGKTESWLSWALILDSHLIGSGESTLLACAVIENRILGCFVGDSRAVLQTADGTISLLTDSSSRHRLGTGQVSGREFGCAFQPGDRLFLMSDGAWTPFDSPSSMGAMLARHKFLPRHRLPEAILDETARTGHLDDMTVVALFA